ncbi:recombinase family protein [Hathewaya histolytica]|uniref:DNA-invertase Hin n=1 Tax=Hathewaya histolytica TaxID=1498 RepID=A0A4U9R8C5_HATHI|nr:recombinase family protein [Hathewaya histolytica]VTQ86931.1 DNA-invertase Hin [Hathewaya histolytica]
MSKIYGYARVSTKGQLDNNSLDQQEKEIKERYSNSIIYREQFTGTKTNRPIFNKVIEQLNVGDTLVCTKLDRFCRTTKEGLELIDILMNKGIKIHLLNMGLIEDTPMGRLIITNLLAFAEFERNMIVERTQTGKAIAKSKEGFKEGRPKKYTKKQIDNALSMLSINGGKYSYHEVEEITDISKSTLIREQRKRKVDK